MREVNRCLPRLLWCGAGLMVLCACAWSQATLPLSANDTLKLFTEVGQLVESTAFAVPGLGRAAAPLAEDVKQSVAAIQGGLNPASVEINYRVLTTTRAYLGLYELLPKPDPFPEEAARQYGELRQKAELIERNFRELLRRADSSLRGSDRDNLARYAEDNRRLQPPQPGNPRVVFLGDSITDGWRLHEYFPDRDFVNRGIGGQITGQMLGRMLDDVIRHKPAAMVFLGGTNDIARGVPLETIQSNITMIADLAEKHGIRMILANLLPISDYHKERDPRNLRSAARPPARIQELNTWIGRFARDRKLVFLDYHSALADPAGFLKAELADDGLHPNSAGYRVMAPLVLKAIEQAAPPRRR